MQNPVLKNLLCLVVALLSLSSTSNAQLLNYHLAKADSLFQQKRYTQSLELYKSILAKNQFSPAMLLKMAYMEEGLENIAQTMYYLSFYYSITKDERAQAKITEMASKHKLSGYEYSDKEKLIGLYNDYSELVSFLLGSFALFLFSLMVYQKRKGHKPVGSLVTMALVLLLLVIHTNFKPAHQTAIVAQPNTYLMSGPSAGASVIRIINEGNRMIITGEQDVWVKIRYQEKDAYIKRDNLLVISI
jgi:tetratricopeptide (TPR) repeat protein